MRLYYKHPETVITEVSFSQVLCASGNEDFGKGPDYGKDIFEMVQPPKPF